MKQENQHPNMLVRVLGSAVLATIIAIVGLSWAIYSTRSEDKAWQQQLDSQATQIANQREQIDLNAEQNRLLYERATLDAEKADIESQLQTPFPSNDGDFAITATALSIQASQVEATQQAIEARQQQIRATQTALAHSPTTVPQTNVRSECIPPEGLVELWDHTQYQWSIGTWGTPNIANFTAGLGTIDTSDPDFSEFRLWISPCNTETHGYISGAQFWPKSPVNEMPYKPVTLGQIYNVDYIPVSTGLWSLGNPR